MTLERCTGCGSNIRTFIARALGGGEWSTLHFRPRAREISLPFRRRVAHFGCETVDIIVHLDDVQSRDTLSLTAVELSLLAVAFA